MVASEMAGPGGGRSRRKRAAIAAAAVDAFLDRGSLGASMDDIAERAGASNATVHAHFGSKEQLFVDVVVATVKLVGDPVHDDVRDLADTDDLAHGLQVVARRQLDLVMTARTVDALARTFDQLDDRGLLDCPDPTVAASQFNWLVVGAPMGQTSTDDPSIAPAGTWVNIDAATRGETKIHVNPCTSYSSCSGGVCHTSYRSSIRDWDACSPTDCDWGRG